jgi:NAD(P)-dependent dehydrogenase (short-subunit alcohol dehydrogenase family)
MIPPMQRLSGQVALVTGGSRGIGRAICQALDAEGARVIVHFGRNREAAEATRATLRQPGAALVQADLASVDSMTRLVDTLDGEVLDILVNNAGVWKPTPLGATPDAVLTQVIDTNFKGVFWLTQALLPKLRDGARIVNLSSVAARVGVAGGRSVYGATKAAVEALTRNWALELAGRGIRVNAVAPGYVDTDMTAEHFSNSETRARALSRHPLGRLTTPEDVAHAVVFLCVDEGGFVTGQSLNVSGGFVV